MYMSLSESRSQSADTDRASSSGTTPSATFGSLSGLSRMGLSLDPPEH